MRLALAEYAQRWGLELAGIVEQFPRLRDAVHRARTVPNTPDVKTVLVEGRTGHLAGEKLLRLLQPVVARLNGDQPALDRVSTGLAAVTWPTNDEGLTKFESDVRAALTTALAELRPASKRSGASGTEPAESSEPLVLPPGTPATAADALRKIRMMTWFQNVIVWGLTVISAYLAFYADNAAFGTVTNYLAALMWALGITQTGTQLVTRVRRPATTS